MYLGGAGRAQHRTSSSEGSVELLTADVVQRTESATKLASPSISARSCPIPSPLASPRHAAVVVAAAVVHVPCVFARCRWRCADVALKLQHVDGQCVDRYTSHVTFSPAQCAH